MMPYNFTKFIDFIGRWSNWLD